MTFKEWYAGHDFEKTPNLEDDLRSCWDAATYAANTRAGDASNEAEKDARRKVAVDNLIGLEDRRRQFMIDFKEFQRERDAIIKAAQG